MGHPIQPNLRNTRSGIVHAALAGYVICQTRTNPGAYTATDEPITCGNCIKQPVTQAADDLDAARAALVDKEIKLCFLAGTLSAITILRDLLDEFGFDSDWQAWAAEELLTVEEADEIAHAVKLIVWRRRGVKVPGDPMSLAAMNADILVGVELAEKYGVAEAYRRAEQGVGVLTLEETEQTPRFVRGLAESRYIENPDNAEGPPCGNLRCDLCYQVAAADLTGGEV